MEYLSWKGRQGAGSTKKNEKNRLKGERGGDHADTFVRKPTLKTGAGGRA